MTEPEDTCRPVQVDGDTVRVRGSGELSEEARAALVALVRVAKRHFDDENPPDSWKVLRAVAFNAIGPALAERDEWLRLTTRRALADAVLTALAEHLGPEPAAAHHTDAEHRLARIRAWLDQDPDHLPDLARERLRQLVDGQAGPRQHVYLSTGCHHGDHTYCQSMTGLNGSKRPGECKHCAAKCVCPCHHTPEQTSPA